MPTAKQTIQIIEARLGLPADYVRYRADVLRTDGRIASTQGKQVDLPPSHVALVLIATLTDGRAAPVYAELRPHDGGPSFLDRFLMLMADSTGLLQIDFDLQMPRAKITTRRDDGSIAVEAYESAAQHMKPRYDRTATIDGEVFADVAAALSTAPAPTRRPRRAPFRQARGIERAVIL